MPREAHPGEAFATGWIKTGDYIFESTELATDVVVGNPTIMRRSHSRVVPTSPHLASWGATVSDRSHESARTTGLKTGAAVGRTGISGADCNEM